MKRRNFLAYAAVAGGSKLLFPYSASASTKKDRLPQSGKTSCNELDADIIILGGGMGGCATALAACRNGLNVIMTEETDWIGGQASQQGVPPDEHPWIETHGAPSSYRSYRNRIRNYYKQNYPLTDEARTREYLNPGGGFVSRICHEPYVTVIVLTEMLAPYISNGQLLILLEYKAKKADVTGDDVKAVQVYNKKQDRALTLRAPYFVDATECGDLLPLTGTEYVTGTESKAQTNELHAPDKARPGNNQAFTVCFAMDYIPGANLVIDRPKNYDYWSSYVPKLTPAWSGKLLSMSYSDPATLVPKRLGFHPEGDSTGDAVNLWNYRKIINRHNFTPGTYKGDTSLVNWPQHDYLMGNLIDVSEEEFDKHVNAAKELNRCFLYWLQTEAPRPDGGTGWAGLRLRGNVLGTEDGMAKYPYIREARRIKAEFTILEEHVGAENRKLVAGEEAGKKAADFYDSIGIGYYRIDLHPSNEGDNYIDFASLPHQIPLGALLPQRMNNLLPANKNIGTTHITNGCYREHPIEWSIGEAVGMLIAYSKEKKIPPRAVRERKDLLEDFQKWIRSQGLETHWP
ncbi:FAD-dependent oxidoreductase [Parabacteroides bouchesdurhonensis]|uniref:FAD-dependent oxidoreductase n=1 Tax=Parabacteroides bouchesdurhonensis TaxID=1936995 RepID=UPI000E5018A6|nr:FAD-dependent oxidoreductase [Parabacteroides bouchesdurhonensis]RHJ91123.1 FAD-dependent oxidoreductase [Bacteroides sp. AM07-16]